MKYLLLLVFFFVLFWLWRQKREAENREASFRSPPQSQRHGPAAPTEIVACQVCGVHLPRSDALIGPAGLYCSEAHRLQAKG